MNKAKTRKTVAKRIKITKTGMLKKRHVRIGHLKVKQSSRTKRRKSMLEDVSKGKLANIRKQLPYGV